MSSRGDSLLVLKDRWLQRLDEAMWPTSVESWPLWRRALVRAAQIFYAVMRDLGGGQISLRAMSLVYYTVIAVVPLLALTFSVLKGLGVHNTLEPTLLRVLEPFLGDYATDITTNMVTFVDNIRVDVLGTVSVGILLYTVLTMMQKMEQSFNYIWMVNQPRTLGNRISEYLFAIIGSPLLILLSVGIASYINTNIFVRYLDTLAFGAWILQFIGFLMSLTFMSLAFAFAYRFIPNTRVHFVSAFIGGIVTTFAWKGLGWVFSNFLVVNSANAVIYAAFFSLILLMLLLYLGWLVLLIGSSVAFYHQHPSRAHTGRVPLHLALRDREQVTLTVAMLIVGRFQRRQPPWSMDELLDHTQLSAQIVESALDTLRSIGFITVTAGDPSRYLPTTDVSDLRIQDLRQQIRMYARDPVNLHPPCPEQQAVEAYLQQVDRLAEEQLGEKRFDDLERKKPDS
ncbi:MAG: YihY/virulence factor BrkB family protein [Pseudohongiellaceae bacterium]